MTERRSDFYFIFADLSKGGDLNGTNDQRRLPNVAVAVQVKVKERLTEA